MTPGLRQLLGAVFASSAVFYGFEQMNNKHLLNYGSYSHKTLTLPADGWLVGVSVDVVGKDFDQRAALGVLLNDQLVRLVPITEQRAGLAVNPLAFSRGQKLSLSFAKGSGRDCVVTLLLAYEAE